MGEINLNEDRTRLKTSSYSILAAKIMRNSLNGKSIETLGKFEVYSYFLAGMPSTIKSDSMAPAFRRLITALSAKSGVTIFINIEGASGLGRPFSSGEAPTKLNLLKGPPKVFTWKDQSSGYWNSKPNSSFL